MSKEIDEILHRNKQAWKNTYRQMDNYRSPGGRKVNVFSLEEHQGSSSTTHVRVFHETPFRVLEEVLLQEEFTPLLVYSMGENFPLEPLRDGARGEKFDLFRRSNFYSTLTESWFPLSREEGVFSPEVKLFKDEEFKTLTQPLKFPVLALSPLLSPRLLSMSNEEHYCSEQDQACMQAKVRAMFLLARSEGCDTLVVGDFGCREGNPPARVVEMFNAGIEEGLLGQVFFAIRNHRDPYKDPHFLSFHRGIRR